MASLIPGLRRLPRWTCQTSVHFLTAGTSANTAFWDKIFAGQTEFVAWWLDRMYSSNYPLTERMTWFWHGHWATAVSKVIYPLPMQKQNNTLRKYALGNFEDMAKAMVVDGALNYWLDNEENYVTSPNENLARELMELMTLGVNKFTQHDVTAAARALTGYSTNIYTGAVTFDADAALLQARHDPRNDGRVQRGDAGVADRLEARKRQIHHGSPLVPFRLRLDHAAASPCRQFRGPRHLLPRECARWLLRLDQSRELTREVSGRVVRRSVSSTERSPVVD